MANLEEIKSQIDALDAVVDARDAKIEKNNQLLNKLTPKVDISGKAYGVSDKGARLSNIDRYLSQYGNPKGNVEWLKKKGYDAKYINQDLTLKGPDNTYYPVDPQSFEPMDVVDMATPKNILQAILEAKGFKAGSKYGGIGGYGGAVGGSGGGTFIGAGIDKLIGQLIGNYDTKSGSPVAEAADDALMASGISAFMPAPIAASKFGLNKAGQAIESAKIPQRLYSAATGVKDPAAMKVLSEQGYPAGGSKRLADLAAYMKNLFSSQRENLLSGKTINESSVFPNDEAFIAKQAFDASGGDVEASESAARKVLDETRRKLDPSKIVNTSVGPDLSLKETISYPSSAIEREKGLLGDSASALYANPDLTGRPKANAQQSLADTMRQLTRDQVPEIKGVNANINAYNKLGKGLEKKGDKLISQSVFPTLSGLGRATAAATPFAMSGAPEKAAAAGIGSLLASTALKTTAGGTYGAKALDKIAKKLMKIDSSKLGPINRALSQLAAQGYLSESNNGQRISKIQQDQIDKDIANQFLGGGYE